MVEEVVPCFLSQLFVAEAPCCIGCEARYEEVVMADAECPRFVFAVVVEPFGKEAWMVDAAFYLVEQFEASHDGEQVVGVDYVAVALAGDKSC